MANKIKIKITVEFIMPVDGEEDTMGKQIDRLRGSLQQRVYDDDGNDGTFEIVSVVPYLGLVADAYLPSLHEPQRWKEFRANQAQRAGDHKLAQLILAGEA